MGNTQKGFIWQKCCYRFSQKKKKMGQKLKKFKTKGLREFQKNYFCYLYIQIAWMIFDLFHKICKHKWEHKGLWHKNGSSDLMKFWWLLVQIYTYKVWNFQKVSYHRTGWASTYIWLFLYPKKLAIISILAKVLPVIICFMNI